MKTRIIRGLICAAAVFAFSCLATDAEATEAFCPGGSSPDGRIVWCADADVLKNCPTGTEKQCWLDNGFTGGQLPFYLDSSYQWQIRPCSAAVGSGCFVGPTRPDGSGPGYHFQTLRSSPPFHTEASMRFYIRWSNGHGARASHGPAFSLSCGAIVAIQPDVVNWNFLEEPGGCSATPTRLFANQPPSTIPLLRDNKWHIIETYIKMETSWNDNNANGKADYGECNGIIKMWTDDALIMSYSQFCFSGLGSQAAGIRGIYFPREYGHRYPPWGGTVEMDNMVVGVGPYAGAGPYIGRAAQENPLGTEDPNSPYYQYNAAMYHFACKNDSTHQSCADAKGARIIGALGARKSQSDCSFSSSPFSTLASGIWRGNAGALDVEIHAPGAPAPNEILCAGANMKAAPIQEASLRVSLDPSVCGSNCGGGLQYDRTNGAYQERGKNTPPASQTSCNGFACGPSWIAAQQVIYGKVYIPASTASVGKGCTSTEKSCIVLSGFRGYAGTNFGHYIGLTITEAGHWGVIQRHNNDNGKKTLYATGRKATYDEWHEFELIVWGSDRITFMIDHQRLLDKQELTYSVATTNRTGSNWLFCGAIDGPCFLNGAVEGIIDHPNTGPATVYHDNFAYGTMSYWSCDGWSAKSCPFPATGGTNLTRLEPPTLLID